MSSSRRPPRGKGKDTRNATKRNRPAPQEPGTFQQGREMAPFDFGVENPEHLVTSGPSGFSPGVLARLGPLHQPMQPPGRSIPGQRDFQYPPNLLPTTNQPAYLAPATAYTASQPPPSPLGINWQAAAPNGSLYGSDSSPTASAHSSAGAFGYASQQNTPDPYMGGYVPPTALHNGPPPGFDVYPWPRGSDVNVSLSSPDPGSLASPSLAEAGFLDSDSAMYEGAMGWSQQQPPPDQEPDTGADTPRRKRAKKSPPQSISSAPATKAPNGGNNSNSNGSSSGSNKSRLRSASRASKNMTYRPEETAQERRSRNSHNLVEKQYRNRLNQQFEMLMNTLPESMRSQTGGGGGGAPSTSGGDSDGTSAGMTAGLVAGQHQQRQGGVEMGEKRLSKAQVLDMSARYIRALERERDELEEERAELLEGMQRLREAFVKQEMIDGG